jgi:hypothetical protein
LTATGKEDQGFIAEVGFLRFRSRVEDRQRDGNKTDSYMNILPVFIPVEV